jgi:aryl-alcohol dehydrogenase-like predicted oxidoreductase
LQYRQLGKHDLTMSAIGVGTWELGGNQYGPIDETEAIAAIHRALDLGATTVDTAPAYGHGHAEEVLGPALRSRRKDIVLVTKCGLDWDDSQRIYRDGSPARIVGGLEESLNRLKTDWVDLFLVHWPDLDRPTEPTMRAMQDILASGKARYIGVSNFNVEQMGIGLAIGPLHAHQMGYNLFDRRVEKEIMPFCARSGMGVMVYGSLSYGLLTGTWKAGTKLESWDWRSGGKAFGQPIFEGENLLRNLEVVDRLRPIARARGVTLPQLAMNWVLGNPAVTVGLTGPRKASEIEDTLGAIGWNLTPAERAQIDEVMKGAAGQTDEPPSSSVQKRT